MLGVPRAHKARYTLATKLNSTWSTLLKVDVKSTVAETGNKSATKSTVADTFNSVADKVDVVASVYGAKAKRSTWLTFNKVDRVEFNFVASVYRLKTGRNVRLSNLLIRPIFLFFTLKVDSHQRHKNIRICLMQNMNEQT